MAARRPGPIMSRALRVPARVYDLNAGWIFGRRFLLLSHIGRHTGERHRTMLEVIGESPSTGEFIVVAGLGRSAQWYRNLQVQEATEVAVGRHRFRPVHRELDADEAVEVLAAYERRNRLLGPIIRWALTWLVGWPYDGTAAAQARLVAELPMVALRPRPQDHEAAAALPAWYAGSEF
jgi:deazaflavin-dependent oxidoreductase (nitroreductase family)